jgi:[acyl-carrier-protein] S-malonyltransferase
MQATNTTSSANTNWGYIFPGQGSQAPGMGKYLYEHFKTAKETFEEASDAIGLDLKKLCFESSVQDLALTENTQPALLTVSVATQRVIEEISALQPHGAAGHSVGEYAALVSAGSLHFQDAVRAVRLRGKAMQNAVPVGQGSMTAVLGLDEIQITALCEWTTKTSGFTPVEAANFNAPGQIVISGNKKALDWLELHFKSEKPPSEIPGEPKRTKLITLQVSAPFHCSMMEPAEKVMSAFLKEISFSKAQFPIVQNINAKAVTDGAQLKINIIQQISGAVRWIQCVENLEKELGIHKLLELGHGKVLAGLVKKISPELEVFNFNSLEDIKNLERRL